MQHKCTVYKNLIPPFPLAKSNPGCNNRDVNLEILQLGIFKLLKCLTILHTFEWKVVSFKMVLQKSHHYSQKFRNFVKYWLVNCSPELQTLQWWWYDGESRNMEIIISPSPPIISQCTVCIVFNMKLFYWQVYMLFCKGYHITNVVEFWLVHSKCVSKTNKICYLLLVNFCSVASLCMVCIGMVYHK